MAENIEQKPQKKKRSILKRILFVFKLVILVILLIVAGVAGAFISSRLQDRVIAQKDEEINLVEQRVDTLVETIEDLEEKNNNIIAENQTLRDQLKTEEERRREEELKRQLNFEVSELGKRLMTFELANPSLYFEYDKNYGQVGIVGHPAVFSDNIVAEGIEISFENTNLKIYIEPWKLSGLALEKVSESVVQTADGKDVVINVLKINEENYLVSAMLGANTDLADTNKLMITKDTNSDQLQSAVDEIRDIVRSVEIDLTQLD